MKNTIALLTALLALMLTACAGGGPMPQLWLDSAPGTALMSVAYSPDGSRVAAGTSDGRVLVFGVDHMMVESYAMESPVQDGARTIPHEADVVAVTHDGQYVMAVSTQMGLLNIWSRMGVEPEMHLIQGYGPISSNAISGFALNRELTVYAVAGSRDSIIRIASLDASVEAEFSQAPRPIRALAFSPGGGNVVSVHEAGGQKSSDVALWDLDGKLVRTFGRHRAFDGAEPDLSAVAPSADGKFIATGDVNGGIVIWGINGRKKADFSGPIPGDPVSEPGNGIVSLAYSPSGAHVAAGTEYGDIILISLKGAEGPRRVAFAAHSPGSSVHVAFSPDGTRLASVSEAEQHVKIWSIADIAAYEMPKAE
jgi:WD40 repeat protein